MSFSKLASSLALLTIVLLFKPTFGVHPLFHICSSNHQNFTTSDPYETNLKELTLYLSHETATKGFSVGSKAHGQHQVYGVALCRGDVLDIECSTCVVTASKEIRNLCPYNKGATIWYDHCLYKYRSDDIFGQIDYENMVLMMCNNQNITQTSPFREGISNLLTQVANDSVITKSMYAIGRLELDGSNKLYGLSQCTRYISSSDCEFCLEFAITKLSHDCDGKHGGRFLGGSCNVRYELYNFFNT